MLMRELREPVFKEVGFDPAVKDGQDVIKGWEACGEGRGGIV